MSQSTRYFLQLAFRGTNYHGWQIQPNARSVQQTLNRALSTVLREEINLVGAGRTDTGVHASCFWAHFDYHGPPIEQQQTCFRLNRYLPDDIAIYRITPVHDKAHARFDAISRTYQYHVTRIKDPFKREFAYFCFWDLDISRMNQASDMLFEYNDFTSFSKSNTQTKTNLCEIYKAGWEQHGHLLTYTIQANRFLRNMVRAVVGTLLDIGQGKLEPEEIRAIIESKNRSQAGYSVPPNGLFLTDIRYPDQLNLNPPKST